MSEVNQKSKQQMFEVLQDEIDRCRALLDKRSITFQTRAFARTSGALLMRDIHRAEQAILDKDDNAMFHALRTLRENR